MFATGAVSYRYVYYSTMLFEHGIEMLGCGAHALQLVAMEGIMGKSSDDGNDDVNDD